MNKLPRYHIIIRIITCAILRKVMEILIASDKNQDGSQLPILSSYNRKGHVCCDVKYFLQLSTYIYVYVDYYKNVTYFLQKKKKN